MDENIVTYSRSMTVKVSNICSTHTEHNVLDQSVSELAIPYSAIQRAQKAKPKGVKEAFLLSGERPDSFAAVRARLDQWGFTSFVEYIYTVAELIFLEGLLPSMSVGYLNKKEIAFLQRSIVSISVMLDTIDEKVRAKYYPHRSIESRLEMIRHAAEVKLPVTTGIILGLGDPLKSKKEAFELIRDTHLENGNIQNVVLQNITLADNPYFAGLAETTKDEMQRIVEMALKILPEDVVVTVPYAKNSKDILTYIDMGIRDIGRMDIDEEKEHGQDHKKMLKELEQKLKSKKIGLQHRLPIFSKYIVKDWYSRKCSQVLDKYRTLLKETE